jgi:cobalamin biosynthesis protein CobT
MTKLCARGKAAAKRKFKVYPSAYANAYASKICAGKIKDPSGTKRKDWGPKKASKGTLANIVSAAYRDKYKSSSQYKKKKKQDYDMTATELNALAESVSKSSNPKKKDRILSSGNKMKIKRSQENITGFDMGGEVRGTGAAIRGKGFKGVF